MPKHYGLLSVLHEARTDISMVLGLIFILLVGGGALSIDAARKPRPPMSCGSTSACS